MAATLLESTQLTPSAFVESVGAIPFRLSTREICVLHHRQRNQYLLAKGRRNVGEHRQQTALREVREETGVRCRLLPVDMFTRAPPTVEEKGQADEWGPRLYKGVCEPFTLQMRRVRDGSVKLIWWYVAAVEEGEAVEQDAEDQERYTVEFYSYADVLEKLTFQNDRDLVKMAIDLVTTTYAG
jgi:8-oxo-dGTP pyrophosphatase MutT (NUDIX family)